MLSIVFLLWLWETLVEKLREETPVSIRQIINAVLGEMGGLGFIGLVLGVTLHNPIFPVSDTLRVWSEEYLGNEEVLVES
jgi:hypothetical protein